MKLLVEWLSSSVILEPEVTYTIGRDNNCDIPINNSRISRTHLRISFNGKRWQLTDLGSSNGTFINGKRSEQIMISDATSVDLGGLENLRLTFTPLQSGSKKSIKPTMRILDKDATRLSSNIGEENLGLRTKTNKASTENPNRTR